MKVLANIEGLAVRATIETADVPKDALVAITGDRQVDIAGAGDVVIGHVSVPGKDGVSDADCTVEVARFKKLIQVKASGGALAAGALVVADAADSGSVSTVKAIGAGTFDKLVGIVWVGGAQNALIEVLAF